MSVHKVSTKPEKGMRQMETVKKSFIPHVLIGFLISIAVVSLASASWLSEKTHAHRGCFGFLGMGYEPDAWGERGCGYGSAYAGNSNPAPDWPEWRYSVPNIAGLPPYFVPIVYPQSLQQAIRGLPFYLNAKP